METLRTLTKRARLLAHAFGLNKIGAVRRVADAVRFFGKTHTFPWASTLQGSKLKGLAVSYCLAGAYEPDSTAYFNRTIKEGWTVIDVGADFGYYTLLYSRLVGPQGRVFAFEPFTARYGAFLLPNLARNVVAIPYGLDSAPRTHRYYEKTHGFYTTDPTALPAEEVRTIVFDDWFAAFGGRVDLVKIDTEGSELRVLEGMRRAIAENPQLIVAIEIAPKVLERSGSSASALLDLLKDLGMHFAWIEADGRTAPVSRFELMRRLAQVKYTNIACCREADRL